MRRVFDRDCARMSARGAVTLSSVLAVLLAADAARASTEASVEPEAAPATASPSTASPTTSAATLGEVVVTARRRSESLQSAPVSATVVSGQAVATRDIATVQDLTTTIPSVQLAQGTTANRQFIRGIGSGDNPSFEQSVGTFVDDVYHGRSRTSESNLFDLDQVEVLKGPQSTYFGNNAIAGALNITTRDPGSVFGGFVRGAYTPEFGTYKTEGAVDLPVNDQFALRIAGLLSTSDGWITDVGAGYKVPNTQDQAIRLTGLWKPTDDLTVRLKAQYTNERERGGLPVVREGCPQPAAFGATTGFCAAAIAAGAQPYSGYDTRNSSSGQLTTLRTEDYDLTATYRADAFTLTSVTAYTDYNYRLNDDLDLTPLNLISLQAPENYGQFSQELRLASDTKGPLEYVAGVYFQSGRLNVQNVITYGFLNPTIMNVPALAPLDASLPLGTNDQFTEVDNTESAFGAVTWHASPKLQFTGALRYTVVDKHFDQNIAVDTGNFTYAAPTPLPASIAAMAAGFARSAGLANVGTNQLSREDRHLSGSASVQYQVTPNEMVYARYDNGFKAGGFNGVALTSAASSLAFAPETVNSFEIGAKSRLLDNRLVLDADVFRSDYSNLQLAGVVPSISGAYVNLVQNAGGAISQGVEISADARLTDDLNSSVSLTYLDAHYTSYPNATPTAMQTLAKLPYQDLTGQPTDFAPKWAASWTLSYERPVMLGLTMRLEDQLFFQSKEYLNPNDDPYSTQAGYVREDASIALTSPKGWELSLIGKNLNNPVIKSYAAAYPTSLGSYIYMTEPPANVTIQMKYSF